MPKKRKNMYWGEIEEYAIKFFCENENVEEKHNAYQVTIEPAFRKLTENIFYTYNFGKILRDFEYVQHELIVHLYEKLNKFDTSRGTKAFSYFGTISKNWLIQKSNKEKKNVFIDEDDHKVYMFDASIDNFKNKNHDNLIIEIIDFVKNNLEDRSSSVKFNNEDKEVLDIIIKILNDYERLDIYNKKQLYVYIREATELPSRKITRAISKLKDLYYEMKREYVN